MPIFKLDIEETFDFQLIGISSHEKDYRLVWAINLALGWQLQRKEDVHSVSKNGKNHSEHSLFVYEAEDDKATYVLVENKSSTGMLLPSLQQFQYVLKVENLSEDLMGELLNELKASPLVLTAFEIPLAAMKDKQNLIFY